jgi:hypothetical protein
MTRFLVLLAILAVAAAPVHAGDPDASGSLRARIEAARDSSGVGFQSKALSAICSDLRRNMGNLQDDDVEAVLDMLVDVVESCDRGVRRYSAYALMPRFAHPRLADALVRYLDEHPDDPCGLAETARTVQVCLGDTAVLPDLRDDLRGGNADRIRKAIAQLAELGDRRGVAELDALMADPDLGSRIAADLVRRRSAVGNSTDPASAAESGARDADRVRAAARDARNRLLARLDYGLRVPYPLHEAALARLGEVGVVVLPRLHNEMHELVDEQYPFITTDFVYHTAMILVRAAVDDLETHWLDVRLDALCRGLCAASLRQAAELPDGDDRRAAELNAVFFAVPARLIGAEGAGALLPPGAMAGDAADELARIGAAEGRHDSAVLGREEDYGEYRPRGRAGRGDARVDAAFQARVWLGRAVFPAKDEFASRRALLIVAALAADPALAQALQSLESVYDVLGGERDDPSAADYLRLAGGDPEGVLADADRFAAFCLSVSALPAPRIHTGVDADRVGALGLRLLGQRRSADGELFQSVIEGGMWPPSGLHVAARLLGSPAAAERLAVAPAVDAAAPGPGLVDGMLHCYRPLFVDADDLPPPFRSAAWRDKQLNNALGAWAETRHAAGPYVKAAHMCMGMSELSDRLHGFVEPYPEFFRRLHERIAGLDALLDEVGYYDVVDALRAAAEAEAEAIDSLRREPPEGLDAPQRRAFVRAQVERERQRDAVRQQAKRLDRNRLEEFLSVLERLERLADVCRRGLPQSLSDGLFLKDLGDRMWRLGFNESSMNVAEESMAACIDVAVEYLSGECLEAGVGPARPIYVAVPADGGRIVCRGAVYGYAEFVRPVDDRLADPLWRLLADLPAAPGREPWLCSASDLVVQPMIGRDVLRGLAGRRSERPENDLDTRRPWRMRVGYGNAEEPWRDGRVAAADLDLLLELARDRGLDGSVQLFIQRNLLAHAHAPGVAEAAGAELRGAARPGRLDRFELMRTVYACAILAAAGDGRHAADLERLRDSRVYAERGSDLALLVDEALRRIRGRAAGS